MKAIEGEGGLREYGLVRVRALEDAPDRYDGWRVNRRPPAVGDVGTLLDRLSAPGHPDRFVVECSGGDGTTVWLADFRAEALEPCDDAPLSAADVERLGRFFGAYFHQDWALESPDWPGVAAVWRAEAGHEEAAALAAAVDRLLASTPDDDALHRRVYDEFGCFYDPRPDLGGPSLRGWLARLTAALRGEIG